MNKYKIISFILLISATTLSVAQNKKKKLDILPLAGEFSIGISLNPIISYAGNLFKRDYTSFNGAVGGEVITPSGVSNTSLFPTASIMGKYMVADNFAIRVNVGILMDRQYDAQYALDDKLLASDPLSKAKVTDTRTGIRDGISVSAGVEYRLGRGRVQGYFGGSVAYAYTMESMDYTYGNAMTEKNQIPTIGNDLSPGYTNLSKSILNARLLKDFSKNGSHTTGVIAHIGIECFIAPQISLGAEMNLSVLYTWNTSLYSQLEGYNTSTEKVEVCTELLFPKSSNLVFGTNSISSFIFINFYF